MAALDGVRILDLSRLLPGPYATRILADLGAEVIKVESPQGGDYARWYPPLTGSPPASGVFHQLNRGKKSLCLDLKQPEAIEVLWRIAGQVDVLVDSFRPGVLTRLGADPKKLMEAHPGLIYCAITGFGLTGPHRSRAGHDIGYLARSGGLSMCGAEVPQVPGIQVADIGGAMTAVSGILAALFERTRTKKGQVIDVSLTEAAMAFASTGFGKLQGQEKVERGQEMLDGSRPCYSTYRTQDGRFLAVGALEPKFWNAFLAAVELPHLRDSGLDGGKAGEAAKVEIQERLLLKTQAQWMEVFDRIEACVEPVLGMDQVWKDPQHQARGAIDEQAVVASPLRLSGTSTESKEAFGPALGAHGREILSRFGVSPELQETLLEKKS